MKLRIALWLLCRLLCPIILNKLWLLCINELSCSIDNCISQTRSLKSKKIIMLFILCNHIFIRHINCRHHTNRIIDPQTMLKTLPDQNYSWDIVLWNVRTFVNNWAVHVHLSKANMIMFSETQWLIYRKSKICIFRSEGHRNSFHDFVKWNLKSEQKVKFSFHFRVILQLMGEHWMVDWQMPSCHTTNSQTVNNRIYNSSNKIKVERFNCCTVIVGVVIKLHTHFPMWRTIYDPIRKRKTIQLQLKIHI